MMIKLTYWTCVSVCLCMLACFVFGGLAQQNATAELRYKIEYATYLGGSGGEDLREVIPLPDGSVLVGGQTNSTDLPTTEGVVQPNYAGDDVALGHPGIYGGDCYLIRLSVDGKKIIAATYFGGSKQERSTYGVALDKKQNVIITSATRSPDLPTTPGCFQPKYGGEPSDWFVAKLSLDLKRLLWCTYIGGSNDESPRGGLTLDEQDNIYLVGGTASPNFPTTPGVFQNTRKGKRDAAVVKLNSDGSELIFSTLLGGDNWDGTMGIRVDDAGDVYVAGHTQSTDFPLTEYAPQSKLGGKSDCYLAKLSSDGSRLLYSTYLGGADNEFAEHQPHLDSDGTVLLAGVTVSSDFPTTEGAFQRDLKVETDGFLTKLSADGKRLIFSTLLGGSGGEFWLMPTPDDSGNIFIVGQTESRDFPTTPNALQPTYGGGRGDGAFAVLSSDGAKLLYATYLGGSGGELIRSLALGPNGEVYLVGPTGSEDFPVTPNAVQTKIAGKGDAFVVKLVLEN
ncbi:SBBP repeat-containing protein [bacterium]|nr:SBBP repeat-containing protein [bacterium]